MSNNDSPADPFKKALVETTKTLADDPELSVSFSVDPPGMSGEDMRLPQVTRRMTAAEVLLARGTADSFAMRRKYHDTKTFNRYAPQGQLALDIYEAMEMARCEAMGARDMPGTAGNIDARIEHEAMRKGYDQVKDVSDAPLSVAAGYLVRQLASGRILPPGAENLLSLWRDKFDTQAGSTLEDLQHTLNDQAAFARFARQVITDLGYGDQIGDDPDTEDAEDDSEASQEDTEDQDTANQDQSDDSDASSEASPEESQDSQDDQTEAQITMDEMADAEAGEETELPQGDAEIDPPAPQPVSDADPNYVVYSGEFDEEIAAHDLAEPEELERLRAYLDQQLDPLRGAVARLAYKLQRRFIYKKSRTC
ncbi:MAG: cobaltochelatase subunit CobT, partial [Silicimonas sp.]|nr:cobaltochelatase subunit CobT [Silicimonas sp.]